MKCELRLISLHKYSQAQDNLHERQHGEERKYAKTDLGKTVVKTAVNALPL
jgi:hypothetical protein